jgi:hypothetical protein
MNHSSNDDVPGEGCIMGCFITAILVLLLLFCVMYTVRGLICG